MSIRFVPTLILLPLLLSACGTVPRQQPPAPISTPDGTPPPSPAPAPGMEVRPYVPAQPAPPGQARPMPSRAVEVLQNRAADQQRAGDYNGAAASLERALRIAPRDALLWQQLALLREKQGRYGQAEEMAAKSNSLAGSDQAALVADNWRLIARARRAVGDLAGARAAEAKAR